MKRKAGTSAAQEDVPPAAAASAFDDADDGDVAPGFGGAGASVGGAPTAAAAARRATQAAVAASRAAHFARGGASAVEEGRRRGASEAWPGPSTALRDLQSGGTGACKTAEEAERDARLRASQKAAGVLPPVVWTPSREPGPRPRPATPVASLSALCVAFIVKHVDDVDSLEGVPDDARRLISSRLGETRALTPTVAKLFTHGRPGEVALADCTQMDAEQLGVLLHSASQSEELDHLELGLCGRGLTDALLSTWAGALSGRSRGALRRVALRGAYRVTDAGVASLLDACPKLASLDVSHAGTGVTPRSLEALSSRAGELKSLTLDHCPGLSCAAAGDALLRIPGLTRLSLVGLASLPSSCVATAAVALGPCLTDLRLTGCAMVDDDAIAAVAASCRSLVRLDLARCPLVGDRSVASICDFSPPGLAVLSLSRCGPDMADGGALRRLSSRLGSSLSSLGIAAHPGVDDHVMAEIARACGRLTELDVSFCRGGGLTDDGLGLVADSCPRLETLHVWGLRVGPKFLDGHSNTRLRVVGLA